MFQAIVLHIVWLNAYFYGRCLFFWLKNLLYQELKFNQKISRWIPILQEENPSRESTIVRTAGKLTPFQFNRIPEIIDGNVPLATRRRQKRYNLKSNESVSSESFCPLCNSPLNKSEIVDWSNMDSHRNSDSFYNTCCSSCQFQILPSDSTLIEQFYMDLPQPMVSRAKQASYGNLSLLRWEFVLLSISVGCISNLLLTHATPTLVTASLVDSYKFVCVNCFLIANFD